MTLSVTTGINTVKTRGYGYTTDFSNRTVNLAAGTVVADQGKAMTQDTTAANTFKLATDGAPIMGRLEVVEDRTAPQGLLVGNVKTILIGVELPVKANATVAVGDRVIGGGGGTIRTIANAEVSPYYVTEIRTVSGTTYATIQHH